MLYELNWRLEQILFKLPPKLIFLSTKIWCSLTFGFNKMFKLLLSMKSWDLPVGTVEMKDKRLNQISLHHHLHQQETASTPNQVSHCQPAIHGLATLGSQAPTLSTPTLGNQTSTPRPATLAPGHLPLIRQIKMPGPCMVGRNTKDTTICIIDMDKTSKYLPNTVCP